MTMSAAMRKKGWTRKQKRLAVIAGLAVVLALAATLVLVALREQWGLTATEQSWIASIGFAGMAVGATLGGMRCSARLR